MHSSESPPAPAGPTLLKQLGKLMTRGDIQATKTEDRRLQAKLLAVQSTSRAEYDGLVKEPEVKTPLDLKLEHRVQALWNEHVPMSIEVMLMPDCVECNARMTNDAEGFEHRTPERVGLLLERWNLSVIHRNTYESQPFITSQWLINAVRSQLHFSQMSAWNARLRTDRNDEPKERRRKLSRESCTFITNDKTETNRLNITYSIKTLDESQTEFTVPPTDHTFPITDIGNNIYLKVILESLPRMENVPNIKCYCNKRRSNEDIATKINDLAIKPPVNRSHMLVDDRMHTRCSASGKHKCSCDDESDGKEKDIKELAKHKRRLRKENKLKRESDGSSEGEKKELTSIPILQASRFDRFRAIGCYRNQTYLTLPSRVERQLIQDTTEIKKTNTIGTQTDDICECGAPIHLKCENCTRMVRSEANYDLAGLTDRKNCDNKCDKPRSPNENLIKRPKLKNIIIDKIEKIISDRLLHKVLGGDGDVGGKSSDGQVPSPTETDRFRWRFDSAASMVFHTKTGLPLTSSPAPLKRGSNCFDYDDSINGVSGIKSALFHPIPQSSPCLSPASPKVAAPPPPVKQDAPEPKLKLGPSSGLLGNFEESALKGRLEPVSTVHGFTATLGASGAFCPPHRRLPVTVFFYAPGGTNAPYMGHINLGPNGYQVSRSGTIQVSLFNPHGTLVKMFVVLYDLTSMPASATTFIRQRTLYIPAGTKDIPKEYIYKYMRYLIHLRFMTSKSGKLFLHTDIRIIVSRKSDMDTATAHSAILNPTANKEREFKSVIPTTNGERGNSVANNLGVNSITNGDNGVHSITHGSAGVHSITATNNDDINLSQRNNNGANSITNNDNGVNYITTTTNSRRNSITSVNGVHPITNNNKSDSITNKTNEVNCTTKANNCNGVNSSTSSTNTNEVNSITSNNTNAVNSNPFTNEVNSKTCSTNTNAVNSKPSPNEVNSSTSYINTNAVNSKSTNGVNSITSTNTNAVNSKPFTNAVNSITSSTNTNEVNSITSSTNTNAVNSKPSTNEVNSITSSNRVNSTSSPNGVNSITSPSTNGEPAFISTSPKSTNQRPCRVFGGSTDFKDFDLGYENQNGVSYELRSFTYGPENPKYSPR